ncbi:hypothetical protein GCM10023196_068890 [Actinoallomurus vinaceus]|uniref:Uncharacterized protein n=1 Tax=Actinoallomurus vinaceus TaxID=1080074 RepID=A0ABP8UJY8_9ACTN
MLAVQKWVPEVSWENSAPTRRPYTAVWAVGVPFGKGVAGALVVGVALLVGYGRSAGTLDVVPRAVPQPASRTVEMTNQNNLCIAPPAAFFP